jgi:Tol biopolymer transport system component
MGRESPLQRRKNDKPLRTAVIVGGALILGFVAIKYGEVILRLPAALNSRLVSDVYLQTGDSLLKISPATDEGLFVTPSISPTGDEAVFHGAVTGFSRIWRYTQADGRTVALTDDDYVAVEPSYSWDGMLIAFAADRGIDQDRTDMSKISNSLLKMGQMYLGGNPKVLNIYIMNADGSDLRQLTTWEAVDMRPTFGPDGQHVLFMSSRRSGSLRELYLYTVSVTGDEEPQLIPNSAGANRPWYSIDGAWIYFWKDIDGRGTLCRMTSDGSEWHPLADDTGGLGSHGPFVDPNGEWLWFHSVPDKDNPINQIFKMPIGGGDAISITPSGFEEEHVAHVTAANNGSYTFDVGRVLEK